MIRLRFPGAIARNIEVTKQLTTRDIGAKYKGSKLGMIWTVLNPLIMLSVYTVVFSEIFQAKWGEGLMNGETSRLVFALNLFCGLTVFNIFSESIGKSAILIVNNPNFVKKIRFPLHTLGTMTVLSAIYNAMNNLVIIGMTLLITKGHIYATMLLIPVIWLPLTLFCMGLTWIFSVMGVYIRDINQILSALISCMMFLSPIFYPASALPVGLQWMVQINPLARTIEQTRQVILIGGMPDVGGFIVPTMLSILWCEMCYRILEYTQRDLSDIL